MSPLRARVAVVVVSLAVTATTAAAQQSPAPAGRFVLGAGVDPLTTEGAASTPALALQGGYERRIGDSRFGLRLEGEYWSRGVRFDGTSNGEAVSSIVRTRTIGGASLLGLYQLAPGARLRPYALGGVGFQQLSLRAETDWTRPAGGVGASKLVYAPPVRANSVALTGGIGLDVPLGRRSLFVEWRATALPNGAGRAERGPIQPFTTPLTFGFRF